MGCLSAHHRRLELPRPSLPPSPGDPEQGVDLPHNRSVAIRRRNSHRLSNTDGAMSLCFCRPSKLLDARTVVSLGGGSSDMVAMIELALLIAFVVLGGWWLRRTNLYRAHRR